MPSVVTTRSSTWATAKTWSASEGLTAALMNLEVRDKVNALKSPGYFNCVIDQAADYTTTSTAFADVDSTNLSATVTTAGGALLIGFSGVMVSGASSNAHRAFLDVAIDGTRLGGDDGLISHYGVYTANASFVVMTAALSAASHIIKLQWKVSNVANTATLYAGAGTSAADIHPRFWGVELL